MEWDKFDKLAKILVMYAKLLVLFSQFHNRHFETNNNNCCNFS